ncbi:MAG: ABC transporter permease [Acidobacteriota bacterium]
MESLVRDVRQTLRRLAKRPGFTLLAVIVVALGVGAATGIFSVLDTLLFRALPYEGGDRIVTIWEENAEAGIERDDVAPANFFDWREQARSFENIAALAPAILDFTTENRAEILFGSIVTEGFFQVMGTRVDQGRSFAPEDFRPGSGKVVLLNHSLWERRFGADPSILGRVLQLDGQPHTVIGVLPESFDPDLLPTVGAREVWMPLVPEGWERHVRGSRWWNVVARLQPEASLETARAEMDAISNRLAEDHPETNRAIRAHLVPLRDHLAGHAGSALMILQGAVALLFVVACANLAGLFLARGAESQGDYTIRTALGAGRWRLIRLFLLESTLIASLGGVLGTVLAFWMVDLLTSLAPPDGPRLDAVRVDARVLLFTFALVAVTAFVAGILPALRLSRSNLADSLRAGRRGLVSVDRGLRSALVVAEIALSVVLLVGAGLLAQSFVRLLGVDKGFDSENVAAVQVFRNVGEDPDAETIQQRREYFRQVVERIDVLPGVRSAAAVSVMPFIETNVSLRQSFVIAGRPEPRPGDVPASYLTMATPGYFRTLGIPLVEGRDLEPGDHDNAPWVAVVNEALQQRHWPGENPVGQRIRLLDSGNSDFLGEVESERWVEIVGIVGQVRHEGLDREPRPELFLSHTQARIGSMTFVARTAGDASALLEPMKEQVWALDPLQTVYQAATLQDLVAESVSARRFNLWLLGTFAVVALVLAAIGLYGVVSYTTRMCLPDFGVRMALGANRLDIFGMVLRQSAVLVLVGFSLGLAGALALTRVLGSFLHEVAPWTGWTFAGPGALLGTVALLASVLPALRATQVDPSQTLRQD